MYMKIENKKSGYTYNEPVFSAIWFETIDGVLYACYRGMGNMEKSVPAEWIRYISD